MFCVNMNRYKSLTVYAILTGIILIAADDILETREAFNCPACSTVACAPLQNADCELVLEPGICACCLTCAKREGEHCGLSLGRCARGLLCRPGPDEPDTLYALLIGRATCIHIDRRE